MAYYAEIIDNKVERVIVVDNDLEVELGEAETSTWCTNLIGGEWVKTSYNGNIRTIFAGIGYEWHSNLDAFIYPAEDVTWTIDTNLKKYVAPIPYPNDGKEYLWDIGLQDWVEEV